MFGAFLQICFRFGLKYLENSSNWINQMVNCWICKFSLRY